MNNVICKPHHAVVTIYGVIDEPMMLQLATDLQQLHHGCNYNHVEFEISSPGGPGQRAGTRGLIARHHQGENT